jgi:hypothetical protein
MKTKFEWTGFDLDHWNCELPFSAEFIVSPFDYDGLLFEWEMSDSNLEMFAKRVGFKSVDDAMLDAEQWYLFELMKFIEKE